jgi:AraC-like DNA-binding protein
MFVRVKGKTVQAYVTHARIDGAAAMLRDTDFTVDTIIRHVGYRSSTSFVAAFRARTGMNPARYRHVAREEQTARQRRAQEELQE